MRLSEALQEFLYDQSLRYNSERTKESYRWQISPFIRYAADLDLQDLTIELCNKYKLHLRSLDISSVTCQSYCRALRVFLKWLFENEYIEDNLSARFPLPKAKRKVIDCLSDAEVRRLYQCDFRSDPVKIRNGCIITLMLDSGIRLSEAVTLRNCNVHLAERYIVVDGKGSKQRIVPLGYTGVQLLKVYAQLRPPSDLFFVSKDLSPITINTVKDMFRKLKKESGIARLRPHLLRHTFATRYLQNGGDLFKLQQILGHTSLEMTKRYLHLSRCYVCEDFDSFSTLGKMKKDG